MVAMSGSSFILLLSGRTEVGRLSLPVGQTCLFPCADRSDVISLLSEVEVLVAYAQNAKLQMGIRCF